MANIQPEINNFKNAVYGEDVRNSMIDLANKLNTEVEAGTDIVNQHNTEIAGAISNANTAAGNANTAADNANDAADRADTSRTNIEANETARQQAEQARDNAEQARVAAEQGRVTAEQGRVSAEQARANTENQRQANEQSRQNAEQSRVDAEADRVAAESARRGAEATRVTAEAERAGREQARVANEDLRQANERERVNNENERIRAFNNMSQAVIPPATTTTLGGVIVGEGLTVDESGKIDVTGGGDIETKTHAAATYATIASVEAKADSVHVHSADDITSGTLPVPRGGTGKATHTANSVLVGNGANNVKNIAPQSGAFYSTGVEQEPQFGTLPVVQGGTGKTIHADNAVLTGNGTDEIIDVSTASGAFYATAANGAPQFGKLPIAQGGTNATTEEDARDNLEAFWTGGDTITKTTGTPSSPSQAIAVKNGSSTVLGADWNGNLALGTVNYGACTTGANVAAKYGAVSTGFQLIEGATVCLKCSNANSVTGGMTLNVNGTGAKVMWAGGKAVAAETSTEPANSVTWSAGAICEFVYSNNAWHYVGNNLDGPYGLYDAEQAIADNAASIATLRESVSLRIEENQYASFADIPDYQTGFLFAEVVYEGADPDAPITSSRAYWWNVLQFGTGTRQTQIAVQAFFDRNKLFMRHHHDGTWYGWYSVTFS